MSQCKHRYVEQGKEDNGCWYRCTRCGEKIFGEMKKGKKNE